MSQLIGMHEAYRIARNSGCMIITINAAGNVIDALSGEILDREGARV